MKERTFEPPIKREHGTISASFQCFNSPDWGEEKKMCEKREKRTVANGQGKKRVQGAGDGPFAQWGLKGVDF